MKEECAGPAAESGPNNPWSRLHQIAHEANPVDPESTGYYDENEPWRLALFNYARGVLGIPEFQHRLRRVWRGRKEPNGEEGKLIEEILDVWTIEHFDSELSDIEGDDEFDDVLAEVGIYDRKAVYPEFLRCLWRVHSPKTQGGDCWEYAIAQAWAAFCGRETDSKTDADATRMIRDLGITEPHCRLILHILHRLADCHPGKPFPVAQTKLAASVTQLIRENPSDFEVGQVTQGQVSAFLSFLRRKGVLACDDAYIPRKQAKLYRITM